MLQIQNISKQYKTGDLVQRALDNVSLNLRDNEFVAILGPSGSGKTTLLNIIGGLDRYDSGDLVINGISTKKYKDRDWDSYRNHTIGFVFQSYNLIPHQTILSNVELALTISGITKAERTRRAKEALEKAGLADHIHKRPNQMSGGQMQRVAIARALVNDPDILLADEPTGALDSETSVQVMELLKEVAGDRLVVMVTHNPELAEAYATRIVNLKDGKIVGDSNPFVVDASAQPPAVHQNMGKSSMSYWTALSLSFNNLITKKARTILVAFAGSIGIIGIALILSLSNGVNAYIRSIEEDTLSEYPLQIMSTSFDLTTMLMAQSGQGSQEERPEELTEDKVHEVRMLSAILSRTRSNDLKSLREFLETNTTIQDNATAIEYSYGLTPYIYLEEHGDYRQVNPDVSLSSLGIGGGGANSMLSFMTSTNYFYSLPEKSDLYLHQYEIKAGHWPTNVNEAVLVTFQNGGLADYLLYGLGKRDSKELDAMVDQFAKEEKVTVSEDRLFFDYEDFLGITYKVANLADLFSYDSEYKVWVDKSNDKPYLRSVLRNSESLTIVGVVQPKEDADIAMLATGVYYPYELTEHLVNLSSDSAVTQEQLHKKDINIFTGKEFGDDETDFDMSKLFTIDEDAMANAFVFDGSKLSVDTSVFSNLSVPADMIDPSAISLDPSMFSGLDLNKLLEGLEVEIYEDQLETASRALIEDYLEVSGEEAATDYQSLPAALEEYFQRPETATLLQQLLTDLYQKSPLSTITTEEMEQIVSTAMAGFPDYLVEQGILDPNEMVGAIVPYMQSEAGQANLNAARDLLQEKLNGWTPSQEDVNAILQQLLTDYTAYAKENDKPDPDQLQPSIEAYLNSDRGKAKLGETIRKVANVDDLQKQLQDRMTQQLSGVSDAIGKQVQDMMQPAISSIGNQIASGIQSAMGGLATSMSNAISFDSNAFSNAFKLNMNETDLQDLMMSMFATQQDSLDNNLAKLGYTDLDRPSVISIYPKDFDSKSVIVSELDSYNDQIREVDEDKVVHYTDTVGTLMSSVTTIVDTVSYVLVAFVAISLVVSSIMIGVITYISVLERRKEIGILRAIGASKRNISSVFNAETFIIGLLAGLFGIGLTRLILIPGNMLIHHLTNNPDVNAYLPSRSAIILIVLSVVLTLLGGLFPSKKAAKSDPVAALRSE